MTNIVMFPGVRDATEELDTYLNAALLELADIVLVCDVIRQPVPRDVIRIDAERLRQCLIKALAASAAYEAHRADMARQVHYLEQRGQAVPFVSNTHVPVSK